MNDRIYLQTLACRKCGAWNAGVEYIRIGDLKKHAKAFLHLVSAQAKHDYLERHHLDQLIEAEDLGCRC